MTEVLSAIIKTNMDIKKPKKQPTSAANTRPKSPTTNKSTLKSDVDAALREIDKDSKEPKRPTMIQTKTKAKTKAKRQRKPWSRKRKIITWSIVGLLVILIAVFGFYVSRIASNTGNIFQGSILDILKKDELKADKNGYSNILIFGTSEDDPGHGGAQLADSIMMLSINQETKQSFTVSLPRDLWVKYNTDCSLGSAGKINAAYYCGLEAKNGDKDKASLEFAKTVSEVVGTDVQYYVAVNYSVVRGLVDSLGGVDVKVHTDDPRGIYDVATGLRIGSGTQHVDGKTALDLSRARNSKGGYGLSESNFDREKNQQQVLKAIQEKALESGTLTNPNKVVSITESLGDNIRTNVRSSELQTALQVASGLQPGNMETKPLNDPADKLVKTARLNGQSIVRPVKGLTDYSDIHAYLWPDTSSTE